jgi:adenosylcobinamide-phosphate guanylyltransferase
MVTALIMAGGKGTRMELKGEKPLIKVGGMPMIQRVIDALRCAVMVDDVVVATSPHTPQTVEFVENLGIRTIKTPGKGYVEDLGFAISNLDFKDENQVVLTVTSDLPLIQSETLDHILSEYEKCGKPAMCVAVPAAIFAEYGLKPSILFGDLVPSGLNILRSTDKQQNEEVLIIRKIELALNINSCNDIMVLEELLRKTRK